jgi:cardiolipin synthase
MTTVRLLKNGSEVFPAMYDAIGRAASSVRLEMYLFADDETGREFRSHLIAAANRGVQVMVLVDAWGAWGQTEAFWSEFRHAGGTVRWFQPFKRGLLPFRNHRKLLLVDDRIAYIGGLNVANEYYRGRDGEQPWRDNALEITSEEVARLRRSFTRMWARAERPLRRRLLRLRRGWSVRGHAVPMKKWFRWSRAFDSDVFRANVLR